MPFRTYRRRIRAGKPECVFTAEPGDVEVQIRSRAFGAVQASSGFTFVVGGPELDGAPVEGDVGLSCFSGEFSSTVEEGDEIWVMAEDSDFQDHTPLTFLVRSTRRPKTTGRGVGGSAGSSVGGVSGGAGGGAGGSSKQPGATGGRGPAARPRVG